MSSRSPRSIAVAAFAVVTLAGGTASADKGAGLKLYEKGKALYEAGDLRGAAARFHDAYAADPEPAYAYSEATCFRKLGGSESAHAADLYELFLRVAPPSETADRAKAAAYAAELRLAVGVDLKARGDCKGALVELTRSLGHAPSKGEPWVHIGLCQETLGDTAGARAAFEKALLAPDLDSALRVAAEARVAALAKPAPPATIPALTPALESPPARSSPVPWIVVGGAAGLVVVGVLVAVIFVTTGGSSGVDLPPADLGPVTLGGW
jgi:tetratricopeptide (TPR) repeat protein